MKILGIEKLSLVDYPGQVCCVLFAGGCNFRCPFCHNSGIVNQDLEEISESEIFEFLNKRKGMLDAVCVSGGEPTLQKDLVQFITKIKALGYKIKLDTNGTNPTIIKELIEKGLVDYVAMDIKNDMENYFPIVGNVNFNISKVKESIDILMQGKVDYEFRTTLIGAYHSLSNIERMGKELRGAKRLYLQKFVENENCIESGLSEVPFDEAKKFKDIIEKFIPEVYLRGYN